MRVSVLKAKAEKNVNNYFEQNLENMLTPFQSFNESQPVFYPVILSLQGFYYPVHHNSVNNNEVVSCSSKARDAQIGQEAIKIEEGVGLSPSDSSAFKTTKDWQTNIGSPNFRQQKNQKEKTTITTRKRESKRSSKVSAFSEREESSHSQKDENDYDDDKSGRVSWSKSEEQKLIQLVQLFGKHWKHISEHLPNRNPKQIRQRYLNYLRADLSNEKWTPEEDARLLELVAIHGHRWKFMEKKMKKRSQNQLKNRYYGHLKKKQMQTIKPQLDLVDLPEGQNPHQGSMDQQLKEENISPLPILSNQQ